MDDRMREVYNYLSDKNYPPSYSKLQKLTLRRYASKFSIQNGELYYSAKRTARKVVMTRERGRELFQEFHCSPMGGHSGVFKTRNALSSRFYWPGMMIDILKWVAECDRCQKIGKPLVVDSTLQSIQVSTVWELVGIDLTGPLPQTADGYQYILTATDYFTKWVEAFPLKTKTAKEVAKCLCTIVYRHGCPLRILSDQGREFVNEVNNSICSLMSIKHSVTAAYHPQTNGLDEKTNHNIKRALAKLVNDHQNDWNIYLDAILFSLRSKVHTSTKFSPFFLMYGREARFPSEVPEELPLSTVILPDASTYDEAKKTRTATSEEAHVKAKINTSKSQQKQKE